MSFAIVSLRGREHIVAVAELLAIAQIHRETDDAAQRGPRIAAEYASSETLQLYGCERDGQLIGIVGVEALDGERAVIRDLAVASNVRGRGVGLALIDFLRYDLGFESLEGDTLESAAEFYRRCGFDVREDGMMSDGTTRWHFVGTRPR